ncbi:hypothetical protein LP419_02140 [Massilia sp. H-1]|nr:hypothetical protein LP419_02140 [Massilia sp. H-1]
MNHLLNIALCAATFATAQLSHAADLTIEVEDVKNANGTVMVALYNSQDSFLKQLPRAPARAPQGLHQQAGVQGPS